MATHYRPNVAGVLLNAKKQIFVAQRADFPESWQFPQGGVDKNETNQAAFIREMQEEIGLQAKDYQIISQHGPYRYDFPPHIIEKFKTKAKENTSRNPLKISKPVVLDEIDSDEKTVEAQCRNSYSRTAKVLNPVNFAKSDNFKEVSIGQEQTYYLCSVNELATFDLEAGLALGEHIEFLDYRWIEPQNFQLAWLPEFKQATYQQVFKDIFNISLKH